MGLFDKDVLFIPEKQLHPWASKSNPVFFCANDLNKSLISWDIIRKARIHVDQHCIFFSNNWHIEYENDVIARQNYSRMLYELEQQINKSIQVV